MNDDGDDRDRAIRSLAARVDHLIEILAAREVIGDGHRRLLDKVAERGSYSRRPHIKLSTDTNKRAVESPDIDCASLVHLCHARCCSFQLRLSREDLADGLRWKIEDPYMMEKADDGYCTYLEPDRGCGCYDARPAICRSYDCRDDRRVWLDWENRIPAPMPSGVMPFLDRRPADDDASDD